MARWMSFYAEYNFSFDYHPGRLNVVADDLSRRPNFEPAARTTTDLTTFAVLNSSVPSSTSLKDIRKAYDPEMVRSHSWRTDDAVTKFDADVDHIDFVEEEESKSKDDLTHHDTDQISITSIAFEDVLTEAASDLAAVHSKSTVA